MNYLRRWSARLFERCREVTATLPYLQNPKQYDKVLESSKPTFITLKKNNNIPLEEYLAKHSGEVGSRFLPWFTAECLVNWVTSIQRKRKKYVERSEKKKRSFNKSHQVYFRLIIEENSTSIFSSSTFLANFTKLFLVISSSSPSISFFCVLTAENVHMKLLL